MSAGNVGRDKRSAAHILFRVESASRLSTARSAGTLRWQHAPPACWPRRRCGWWRWRLLLPQMPSSRRSARTRVSSQQPHPPRSALLLGRDSGPSQAVLREENLNILLDNPHATTGRVKVPSQRQGRAKSDSFAHPPTLGWASGLLQSPSVLGPRPLLAEGHLNTLPRPQVGRPLHRPARASTLGGGGRDALHWAWGEGLDRRSAMPKHQAPRSWAITRVTELPARARWAPSGGCRNCEGATAGTPPPQRALPRRVMTAMPAHRLQAIPRIRSPSWSGSASSWRA